MGRKESEIQRSILDYLKSRGIMAVKVGAVNYTIGKGGKGRFLRLKDWDAGGSRGIPDIMGIMPDGRALCIEVKAEGGKPSPAQIRYLEAAQAQGAIALIATSVDDVERKINLEFELADGYDVTRERVRQIQAKALYKLKKTLDNSR
jgi:hypothetical protein